MPEIIPRARVETAGLVQGIASAKLVSRRSLPEMVNTAAYWIAVNTKNSMPSVSAQTISSQLNLISTPAIGRRGKPLKRKRMLHAGVVSGQQGKVPLAAMIIAARAKPGSNYNRLTNNRWALQKNPFAGVSRTAGAAAMRTLVDKMGKSRFSSTRFLLAGWLPVIRLMSAYAVQKYVRGGSAISDVRSLRSANLGDAQPARGVTGGVARAVIENDVGMEGRNGQAYNRALNLYGLGPFQRAIDREGAGLLKYALEKLNQDMAAAVKPSWG